MQKTAIILFLGLTIGLSSFVLFQDSIDESKLISYTLDPLKTELKFYWKDKDGKNFENFQSLKSYLEKDNKELLFAMNGGMYKEDLSPLGLYIENGKVRSPINTVKNAYGNFYLQPNGIFYLTIDHKAFICKTEDFSHSPHLKYATQSGPLLLIDGQIHPKLIKGSNNMHIRNGVGILPNGNLLLAMSKEKINFYDFASFFKQNGCDYALYLDGFVSRTYLPAQKWEQMDGKFGVILAETKSK